MRQSFIQEAGSVEAVEISGGVETNVGVVIEPGAFFVAAIERDDIAAYAAVAPHQGGAAGAVTTVGRQLEEIAVVTNFGSVAESVQAPPEVGVSRDLENL